jgi:hypothetical protein
LVSLRADAQGLHCVEILLARFLEFRFWDEEHIPLAVLSARFLLKQVYLARATSKCEPWNRQAFSTAPHIPVINILMYKRLNAYNSAILNVTK